MNSTEQDDQSANTVVELEFELADSSVPIMVATESAECRSELDEIVPHGDGRLSMYYSFEGCDPDRVEEFASTHETTEADVHRLVERTDW